MKTFTIMTPPTHKIYISRGQSFYNYCCIMYCNLHNNLFWIYSWYAFLSYNTFSIPYINFSCDFSLHLVITYLFLVSWYWIVHTIAAVHVKHAGYNSGFYLHSHISQFILNFSIKILEAHLRNEQFSFSYNLFYSIIIQHSAKVVQQQL